MARNKVQHTYARAPEDPGKKRTVVIFSLFMIFLLVFSTFAYYFTGTGQGSNQMKYGEYEFTLEERAGGGSVLVTTVGEQTVEFQNLPIQVTHLAVDPLAITLIKNAQQVALVADPTLEFQDAALVDYARLEIGLATLKTYNAMTIPSEQYALPVITCEQSSVQMPVLLFNFTNQTSSITTQGTCITINGAGPDLMRLKDRLIFEYLDIMRNAEVVD